MRVLKMLAVVILLMIATVSVGEKLKEENKISVSEYKRIYDYINVGDNTLHMTIELTEDSFDVYTPAKSGYRYGPSIIINEDGSMDAWFATPGNGVEWDWITYRHSNDGITWSKEQVVLRPTKKSLDAYSVCDPGVIYFNGYYYLGYTSTTNKTGYDNCIYVARSKNAAGPYEKWNGEGWGGNPQPIIIYDDEPGYWGAGEISFVIVDETLYCYYTWMNQYGNYIKLVTANINDENWPANLEHHGKVFNRNGDSVDVIYVKEFEKFLVFSVVDRFTDNASIGVLESSDGYTFYRAQNVRENFLPYSHNLGISKGKDGNVSVDDNLIIGYAYGQSEKSWGKWSTRFQKINLVYYVSKLSKTN